MIKARLVGLLSHAKKYIVYTVLWQWAALLSQIVAVFSIARLLEKTSQGTLTSQEAGKTAVILLAVVLVRFFCERMQTRSSYMMQGINYNDARKPFLRLRDICHAFIRHLSYGRMTILSWRPILVYDRFHLPDVRIWHTTKLPDEVLRRPVCSWS